MSWLIGLAVAAISTVQAEAQADRFPYKLEVTPEAGQVDPVIEKRFTPQFDSCQKHAVVTYEHAACFEAEFARQDAALNLAWKTTFHRVPAAQRVALLNAQRKWIAERDPFCKTDADGFKGGTITPIVYSDCRVELTIRRTIWLEALSAPVSSPAGENPSGPLKAFLRTYLHETAVPADDAFKTRYAVAWKDLNGDGRPEAVVYLMGAEWCGSGGCTLLVLEQSAGSFTVRGRSTITSAPIAVLPSTNDGWRDLVVQVGGGGARPGQAVLPFWGDRYAGNPTLPPARRLSGHEAAEVLIKAEDRGETL
jgi:uncharacterized protein YecT (DUF1311 family)